MLEAQVFLFVEDDLPSIHYFRRGLINKGASSDNIFVAVLIAVLRVNLL